VSAPLTAQADRDSCHVSGKDTGRAGGTCLSGMAPAGFAETSVKGSDFAQNGPLRPNTSQRSQVVVGHGHCVRNRRKSETVAKSPEKIPPSPLGEERRIEQACFSSRNPRLIAQRVIVDLHDFAETLLTPFRPRVGLARASILTR
jgi:hypothetical protein